MNKQQLAIEHASKWANAHVRDVTQSAFIAGWEAHEALPATDTPGLQAMIETIIEKGYDENTRATGGGYEADTTHCHGLVEYCTPLLIKLMKPSEPDSAEDWEDRCRSAEDALKALVNMKQWKDRSGKDEIYMRQQPIAWAEANNHLATYYEEYEKDKSLTVATHQVYTLQQLHSAFYAACNMINYQLRRDNPILIEEIKHLHKEYFDKVYPEWKSPKSNEAEIPKVFTREQVEDALFVGRGFGQLETTEMSIVKCREYMNANYPIQK
jgi:hypothetical protein